MFETFRTKAQAVSAEVHRVPAGAQALDLVLAVLGREGVGDAPGERAVWCEGPILGSLLTVTRSSAASPDSPST